MLVSSSLSIVVNDPICEDTDASCLLAFDCSMCCLIYTLCY